MDGSGIGTGLKEEVESGLNDLMEKLNVRSRSPINEFLSKVDRIES